MPILSLVLYAAIMAAPPSPEFAALQYPARPLVQQGSGNLLPMHGWDEGLRGWNPKGDVSVVEQEGEKCLRLGARRGDQTASFQVYVPDPKPSTLYRLTFETRFSEDIAFDWSNAYPGLHGWLSHSSPTQGAGGAVRLREMRRSDKWLRSEYRLFTHADVQSLYVSLGLNAVAGHALLRRLECIEEPVAEAEGRVILQTPSGEWAEVGARTGSDEVQRPVFWALDNPDRLRHWMTVTAADVGRELVLRGTPGEMCVGALALSAGDAGLTAVKLMFSDLTGENGALAVAPTWKWVVFHPRLLDTYGRGRVFEYLPNFLVERPEGVDCPARQTTGFWVNLRVPDDAAPGRYAGQVTVSAAGFEGTVPVTVEVYPFRLVDLPGKIRHLYHDAGGRQRDWTEEQILAEYADVRDHGYESVNLSAAGEFVMQEGKITGYRLSEEALRMISRAQRAGLKGPFGFWVGRWPAQLRALLGLPESALDGYANTWPPALADAMVDALKALKSALAEAGVEKPFIIAIDEPGYWKRGSPERYAWEMDCYRRAGIDSYCTTSVPPPDPLGMFVTYHCYGGGQLVNDPTRAAEVARVTREHQQQLWYYCTGSYSGQIGNLLHNRYWSGFMFHRTGADGTASWTFQRPRGNPFDDFLADEGGKARGMQPCITYPDPEHPGHNLDTPTWEGLRQGWYDHRYAATLQALISQAGPQNAAAAAAQRRLDELMGSLPWNGTPWAEPGFDNARLDQVRAEIAAEIMKLKGAQANAR